MSRTRAQLMHRRGAAQQGPYGYLSGIRVAPATDTGWATYNAGSRLFQTAAESAPLPAAGASLDVRADIAKLGVSPGNNSDPVLTWADVSGNGKNATLSYFTPDTASGWAGAGTAGDPYRLVFDGVDSIALSPSLTVSADNSCTFEAWAIPGDPPSLYRSLIAEAGSPTNYLELGYMHTTNTPAFTSYDGTTFRRASGAAALTDGLPHHLVGVLTPTGHTLYVDGAATTADAPGTLTPSTTTIGYNAHTLHYHNGSILLARIYPFALSPEEVAQNYALGWTSNTAGRLVYTDYVTIVAAGVTAAGTKVAYARNPSAGRYGPVVVTDTAKSGAWETAAAARWGNLNSLWSILADGDLLAPLSSNAHAYVKRGGASPFDDALTNFIVFDGNSLTYGDQGAVVHGVDDYPTQCLALLSGGWSARYPQINGDNTAGLTTKATTWHDPYCSPDYLNRFCVFWEGINSMSSDTQTPAMELAAWDAYCDARTAAGFEHIIVLTLPAGNDSTRNAHAIAQGYASWDAMRQAFNTLLMAGYATFADAVVDIGTNEFLGNVANCGDGVYFADQIHLTALGYSVVAGMVKTAIEGLL